MPNRPDTSRPGGQRPPADHRTATDDAGGDKPAFVLEAPVVTLPKGGGALRGIDEQFKVNPATGTLALTVPLPLTPARDGAVPPVRLGYDSGAGASTAGLGWALHVPSIRRRTDRGVPTYDDGEDVCQLAGADDLVPDPVVEHHGDLAVQRHRPRVEGDFARIERVTAADGTTSWWRVTTRDNVTTFYGSSAATRVADPADGRRIFEWLPSVSFDDRGNGMVYGYVAEDLAGVPHTAAEAHRHDGTAPFAGRHLKRIAYGNRVPVAPDPAAPYGPPALAEEFLFEVVLDYGEHDEDRPEPDPAPGRTWPVRPDAFSRHRSGFEIRCFRLLRRVLMFHRFPELHDGAPTLVASLDLAHGASPAVSHLRSVTRCGYHRLPDGSYSKRSLPALQLTYAPPAWDTAVHAAHPDAVQALPAGTTAAQQWVDLHGEGIAGVFTDANGTWYYAANRGEDDGALRLEAQRAVAAKPSLRSAGVVQFEDLDGDGRRQVVVRAAGLDGYFDVTQGEVAPFRPFPATLRLDLHEPHVRRLDLTGDGRADVLVADDGAFTWHRSRGTSGFDPALSARHPATAEGGPALVFAGDGEAVLLADMTGDGLTDLVRVRPREVSYWPNRGHGRFGARVALEGVPALDHADRFDPRRVRLADLDGTGPADLLYLGREGVDAYPNLAGNALGERIALAGALPVAAPAQVSTADVLGTGTTCLVWSSPLPADAAAPLRYVDPMAGRKPHLLTGYATGLGKEVAIDYVSSTRQYLDDKAAGRPWATRLPFPVHCVRRVEVRDRIAETRLVSTYRHRHGRYDHREREFRGFAVVDQIDAEEVEHWEPAADGTPLERDLLQAPVLTRTWFHTGTADPDVESRLREEHWDAEQRRQGFDPGPTEPALPPTRAADAEALRACHGRVVRREVFGLDAPALGATADERRLELTPYSVETHAYAATVLQASRDDRPGVVLATEAEKLALAYDRDLGDPRTEHTLNVVVDELGLVREAATVAYGRRTADPALPADVAAAQTATQVGYSVTEFTGDVVDAVHHRLRRPSRTSTYDLRGLARAGALFTLGDFAGVLSDAAVTQELLNRSDSLFYAADLTGPAPLHDLGDPRALPHERYELAFADDLLADVFGDKATDVVLTEGGYLRREGGWWVPSGRFELLAGGETPADARARFFCHIAHRDAWGARTTLAYLGDHHLLLAETVDAAGNHTRATDFDLRTLHPVRLVDPNDNVTQALLDELGWLKALARRGKGAEADDLDGGTAWTTPEEDAAAAALFTAGNHGELIAAAKTLLGRASVRHVCDVHAQPPVVATILRERHVAEAPDSPVQVSFEYSNGAGRVQLAKVPAEPAPEALAVPRWLGTGRRVVNNKGRLVKEHQPFFAPTPAYETDRQLVSSGVASLHRHDPIGREVRVDHPDGTLTRTDHSAWARTEHDRNDTVLESRWYDERVNRRIDAKLVAAGKDPVREAAAAAQATEHAGTPSTRHVDAAGRPVLEDAHAGFDGPTPVLLRTRHRRDAAGRIAATTDPRDIVTIAYRYDLRGTLLRYDSADSGRRLMLATVAGEPLRAWDQRGHELRFAYDDPLHRLTAKRVLGGDGPEPLDHVFERCVYGEGLAGDAAANLRTRLAVHYDTAGRTTHDGYDLGGNLVASTRRFAADHRAVTDWSGPDPDSALGTRAFAGARSYDALDRVTRRAEPDGSVVELTYNPANLLDRVQVTRPGAPGPEAIVTGIAYDERGQRRRIGFGNGVVTDYVHDAETFRLVTLTSRRGGGAALEDLHHTYDAEGNLTHLVDAAVPTVWFANAMITGESTYRYDALYRLTDATGREHAGQLGGGAAGMAFDVGRLQGYAPGDALAWQNYSEHYAYDAAGNLTQLVHASPGPTAYTRDHAHAADSNRLLSLTTGGTTYPFEYQPQHGFMTGMPHLSFMAWTFRDELAATATQVVAQGTPETTWYVYDGDGRRVRKVTEAVSPDGSPGRVTAERVTLDGLELEFDYGAGGAVTTERRALHVSDDRDRVAILETQLPAGGAATQVTRYQGVDHLGSAHLETDEAGRVISLELYHPFGTTAHQATDKTIAAAAKRYRYTGMERDEESGLAYHGARHYAPWLGRWLSPDTHAESLDGNRYAYAKNRPTVQRDRNGLYEEPVHGVATYRLAVAAGFTPGDAAKIAIATAGMDHDAATRPGDSKLEMFTQVVLGRTQEYHFPSEREALGRVDTDIAGGARDLEQFGRHLHSLEDVGFKQAPGPHTMSPVHGLSKAVGTLGAGLVMGGYAMLLTGLAINSSGLSHGLGLGLMIAGGVIMGLGALAIAFALRADGVGHPTYKTEHGAQSSFSSHISDEAYQNPVAYTKELREIYAVLQRAAVAHYGHPVHADPKAADAAIAEIVAAKDECNLNLLVNQPTTISGQTVPSYRDVVTRLGRWKPEQIDASVDDQPVRFAAGVSICP